MSGWSLEALNPRDGAWQRRGARPGETFFVRAAAGADSLRLRWMRNGISGSGEAAEPAAVLEIPATADEIVALEVRKTIGNETPQIVASGRPLLHLPPDTPLQKPRRTAQSRQAGTGEAGEISQLDLVLLVDATLLQAPQEKDPTGPVVKAPLLIPGPERAEAFSLWLDWISCPEDDDHPTHRASALSFGDHDIRVPVAQDLQPSFLFDPDPHSLSFAPFCRESLQRQLDVLRPSSGGDAVDAVADGLAACIDLPWRRREARKCVLLIGDSPGYSILHPGPEGTAAFPRALDVDTTCQRLWQDGIELATVWLESTDGGSTAPQQWNELQRFGREQYERLASRRDLAFTHSPARPIKPGEIATAIRSRPRWSGRGSVAGLWEET